MRQGHVAMTEHSQQRNIGAKNRKQCIPPEDAETNGDWQRTRRATVVTPLVISISSKTGRPD